MTTATQTRINYGTLEALYRLADVTDRTGRVAFLLEDGKVLDGTARHFVRDERGGFIGGEDNVYDAFVRITMDTGLERFEPVADLIEALDESFFIRIDKR